MTPLALLRVPRAKAAASLTLGALVVLGGVGLTVSSNTLIARAGFHPGLETLSLLIIGVRFFGIARAALRYLERLVSHDLTFRALAGLRVRLYQRLEPLSPLQLFATRSGDALERFQGDVETLQNAWLRGYAPLLVAIIISSLTSLALALLHPWLGIVGLSGFLWCGWLLPLWARQASRTLGSRLTHLRAGYSARLQDALDGSEELLMLGASHTETAALEAMSRDLALTTARLGRIAARATASANLIAWLTALGLIAIATPLINAHRVPLDLLGAIAFGVLASFEALLPLGAAATSLERTDSATARIATTLEQTPLVTSPDPAAPPPRDTTLRFTNVSFAYASDPVLEDLSFTLEPGRWLAVIGHSGAGKSTLTNLAVRFCDPQRGHITLGGTDLRSLPLETLRAAISVMPQNAHIFETSVRHNLLVSRHSATEFDLWAALEAAELASTIRALPEGLDTPLNNNGARLSSGERQRLLLARALLRQANILILDEPTANLDAETERALMQTMRRVTQDKAVLLITHRLNILEPSDDTLALESGRVVNRGEARVVLKDWL